MATPAINPRARSAAVLTKAFLRAGEALQLPQRSLARIVGVSEASLSRLLGDRRIDPTSKEGELALLFLRAFRSLDAVCGGNTEHCVQWLHASNLHLNGTPAELIERADGLVHVVDYLDAMRG